MYLAMLISEENDHVAFDAGDVIQAFHPSMLGQLVVSENKDVESPEGSTRHLAKITDPSPAGQALEAELQALVIARKTPQKPYPFASRDFETGEMIRKCVRSVDFSALPIERRAAINHRRIVAPSLQGAEIVFKDKPLAVRERRGF